MKLELTGGQAKSRSIDFNDTIRKNCYLEVSENPNSKSPTALIGRPGLKLKTTLTPTFGLGGRGEWVTTAGRLFAVVGNTLFELDADLNSTNRGTLNTNSGTVKFADNGIDLTIVDGTNGYNLKLSTNVLLPITVANFPNAGGFPSTTTDIVFIDQYLIAFDPSTFKYYISGILDAESWNALDFGTAEYAPDKIKSLEVLKGNIWIFCDYTTEVHFNSGDADFPFERRQGAVHDFGTEAKYSTAKLNNSLFFLGSNKDGNRVVFKTVGFNIQRVSDHDIEYQLGLLSSVEDAIGFTYQQGGHYFYQLTFLIGNKTFVYDDSNGTWHERTFQNDLHTQERSREIYHALFNEVNYVMDRVSGNIYEYDLDYYSDNGNEIIREFTLPAIHADQKFVYFRSIQIDMETGVGLKSGQGSDPIMDISWSDDGHTKFDGTLQAKIGKIGEFKTRVHRHRLGRARNRVFTLSMSEPVKFFVISAILDIVVEDG